MRERWMVDRVRDRLIGTAARMQGLRDELRSHQQQVWSAEALFCDGVSMHKNVSLMRGQKRPAYNNVGGENGYVHHGASK